MVIELPWDEDLHPPLALRRKRLCCGREHQMSNKALYESSASAGLAIFGIAKTKPNFLSQARTDVQRTP